MVVARQLKENERQLIRYEAEHQENNVFLKRPRSLSLKQGQVKLDSP
jgi:hypothetical protein